ncbi:unnamed protein product [Mytilus coruscus]|uniref:Uncharacterized protein n=1 Tax=Mytilus coruscus TaxID=42192 RepID=A0A6J8D194_MYTCO|nr:unnamed protein product [Mytilus coruscus]
MHKITILQKKLYRDLEITQVNLHSAVHSILSTQKPIVETYFRPHIQSHESNATSDHQMSRKQSARQRTTTKSIEDKTYIMELEKRIREHEKTINLLEKREELRSENNGWNKKSTEQDIKLRTNIDSSQNEIHQNKQKIVFYEAKDYSTKTSQESTKEQQPDLLDQSAWMFQAKLVNMSGNKDCTVNANHIDQKKQNQRNERSD